MSGDENRVGARPGQRFTSSIWRWIPNGPRKPQEEPSPQALADRARREAMGDTRSLTGQLMGDPPAGRSALEQKTQTELRAQLGLDEPTAGDEEQIDE